MKPKIQSAPRQKRPFRLPLKHFFSNRNIKDRLFCYIFEHDREALLQLYNVLNNTDYHDKNALQIVTLDNVVYISMHNDLAFVLTGTLNLYEHQSTVCPNIPLRLLLYIAAEYEVLTARTDANIYGSKLVKLPAPRCIVFYNGDDAEPDEKILSLSDAFTDDQGNKQESSLELSVRVLNINYGHNKELTEHCTRLKEYSFFVAKIKEFLQQGCSTEQAVDKAVVFCIEHKVMADILLPFRAEVKKMLLTEYNEKKIMKLFKKEAREDGLREGRELGRQEGMELGRQKGMELGRQDEQRRLIKTMLQNGNSPQKISEMTGLSMQQIQDVEKEE